MAISLPRNIQLKLDQTLAQWQQWRCDPPLRAPPVEIRKLSEGISNHSILVKADSLYVVRIDGVNPSTNGLNRQIEYRALDIANAHSLAPTPRYFNPELGALVCSYLPPDNRQTANITDTANLLRAIHRLPPVHSRLNLHDRIARYERQLQHSGHTIAAQHPALHHAIRHCLDNIEARNKAPVLCHNDLLQANRIYSGAKLWALDWEYCAMGNALFDLAVVVTGDNLNMAQRNIFLDAYLQRPASIDEQLEIQQQCCVYRYIELLWYGAVIRADNSVFAWEEKLSALRSELSSLAPPIL